MNTNINTKYDPAAAAERLGVVKQTMSNWRQQRRGPVYFKIGGKIFYKESDLDAYEQAGRIDPNER